MKKIFKIIVIVLMMVTTITGIGAANANHNTETCYAAIIRQGNTGSTVRKIQQKLKNWGYYKGSVDGIFGSGTKQAVKYFQRKNKLVPDGIVGDKTLKALGISGVTDVNGGGATGNYSDADVQLLARVIYGEARGESYVGQVAVGAVVLNRIRNASFPNTMSGVVYQKYAFTAVSDGQINLKPDSTARKAAQDAMNGWDPTYGAVYYYNPATATSSWIFSRKTTVVIGRHVFAV